ncbi:MAG: PilN domain-containing protein [Hormoscilla sp. GM7CHS1pb]|nr:PilN domain-containing protein [Hormoscilla sp. GM7CHS1pb]
MYSLEINFLKDRPEYQQPKKETGTGTSSQINPKDLAPVAVGLMVAAVLVGGALGIKIYYLDPENAKLEKQLGQADRSIKQIEAKKNKIAAIKKETEEIEKQTEALATVFNQIKPWSALLQEIRDRTPGSVQIEELKQVEVVTRIPAKNRKEKPTQIRKVGIEITGLAKSYNDVNDFMLLLTKSSFLNGKETELVSTRMRKNPIRVKVPERSQIKVELPPVVGYKIRTFLSDAPAEEILAELERKGAVGLVNRIENLQRIRE